MKTKFILSMAIFALLGVACQKSEDKKDSPAPASATTAGNTSGSAMSVVGGSLCGITVSKNEGVYGFWLSDKLSNLTSEDGKTSVTLYMAIDQNKIHAIAVCKDQVKNTSVCAVATSYMVITTSTIQTTESNSQSVNLNESKCTASIDKGNINYTVNGNTLMFMDSVAGNLEQKRQ